MSTTTKYTTTPHELVTAPIEPDAIPGQVEASKISIFTAAILTGVKQLQKTCHKASLDAGWWIDPETGLDLGAEVRNGTRFGKALVAEKLCLTHSEISEAMEGHRRDSMDDHLPNRKMIEVELADAYIRIADLAGLLDLDLAGAVVDKLAYNAQREDHKLENRAKADGKKY